MKNKTISFWRIAVFSIIAYSLIYIFPGYLFLFLDEQVVEKKLEVLNEDFDLIEQIITDSLDNQIDTLHDYDIDLIKELYNKVDLTPPSQYFEKLEQPHNDLWNVTIYGELFLHLIDRVAKDILQSYNWILIIFYSIFLVMMVALTYVVYKKLYPYIYESDLICKIKQKSRITKIVISIDLLLCSFILFYFIYKLSKIENLIVNNSDISGNLINLVHYILVLFLIYLLHIFSYINNKSNSKYSIKNVIELLCALVFIITIIRYLSKAIKVLHSAYYIYFSNQTLLFIGYERFFSFIVIMLITVLAIVSMLYVIYNLIIAPRRMNRLAYLLKIYFILIIMNNVFDLYQIKIDQFSRMVNVQSGNMLQHKTERISSKIQAETYQWFHKQKDAGKNTNILPNELTLSAESMDDVSFTKEWDGNNLVMYFKFNFTEEDSIRTMKYELSTKKGESLITIQ